jgi:hypothetical protein
MRTEMALSGYICGNIIVFDDRYYGRIVLTVNDNKIEKPSKRTISEFQLSDALDNCKVITNDIAKLLNISLKKIEDIMLDERESYTIYEFTYMTLKAYIVEYYNGYSGDFKYDIYNDLDDARASVFLSE